MSYKKFTDDYRLDRHVNSRGRTVTTATYIGKYYRLTAQGAELARARRLLPLLAAVGWAALITAFSLRISLPRRLYVLLPHICCLLPMFYYSAAAVQFVFCKPPLKREQAQHITSWTRLGALFDLILSAAASVGYVLALILQPGELTLPGDAVYAAALLVLVGVSAAQLALRKLAETVETKKSKKSHAIAD